MISSGSNTSAITLEGLDQARAVTHGNIHQRQPFQSIRVDMRVAGILSDRFEKHGISTHEERSVHLVSCPADKISARAEKAMIRLDLYVSSLLITYSISRKYSLNT